MTVKAILAAALVLSSGAARADWDKTRWGMTPAEVAASGAPLFRPTTEGERKAHSRADFEFRTTLYGQPVEGFLFFRNGRLREVQLWSSTGARIEVIRDGISLDYGVAAYDASRISGLCLSDKRIWAEVIILAQLCPEGGTSYALVDFTEPAR
jgi:hypothetical protein